MTRAIARDVTSQVTKRVKGHGHGIPPSNLGTVTMVKFPRVAR
jgi:hypothetical protein